jgi:hypothetical protein
MSRFQKPNIVRLSLSNGDWIEVRERLSAGQVRRMSAAAFTDVQQTDPRTAPRIGVDFARLALARTMAYLVDWSFRDDQGRPVKVTQEAIEALTPESLAEIEEALDKHIAAMEAEKKDLSTEQLS